MIKQFGQGSCSGFPAFLPRLRIKIAIFGVCWWTEYVRTLNLSITRVLKVMLRRNISKRKKEKKESALPFWKENAMQYFFAKNMDVFSFTTIFFAKNRLRLDIVSAFFWLQNFTFFFLFFSGGLLFDWGAIKVRERNGKDSGVTVWILGTLTHDCARWRNWKHGLSVFWVKELGRASANRGNRHAEKWWGSTGSVTGNFPKNTCTKKRLERQRYGGQKENAFRGRFQHASPIHYKS